MAKRPKDPNAPSRAEKTAAFKSDQDKKTRYAKIERGVIIASVIIGLVAAGVIWKKHHDKSNGDPTVKALQAIGTTPVVAGCGAPTNDPSPKEDTISQPGQKVAYPEVPPSAGPHLANPVAVNDGGFYTAKDRPPMEGLVANLNAGWTVLWYDAGALGPDQVAKIQKASGVLRKDKRYSQFVATEWDASYGTMPAGTPIALVRWTKQPINGSDPGGHRAFCHETSGEAMLQYMIYFGAPIAAGESND